MFAGGFSDSSIAFHVRLRNGRLVDIDLGILLQILDDGHTSIGIQQRGIKVHVDLEGLRDGFCRSIDLLIDIKPRSPLGLVREVALLIGGEAFRSHVLGRGIDVPP